MKSKLGKGMMIVLIANIIHLLFNLISNLVLPKHLPVESYAALKTYQLYMSYIGIIHLGYNDGIYLRYGGKNIHTSSKKELSESISIIRLYLIVIMVIGIIIGRYSGNYILLIVSVAMVPANMLSYFQYMYQACGEFSAYSKILNFITIGTFAVNMVLIFLINTNNQYIFLWTYVVLNVLIWLFSELFFNRLTGAGFRFLFFSFQRFWENVKTGIFLTLGNFSSVLMTSMDRWFVTYFIDTFAFAQYSFAVTMEGFLNTAISPITVTLYNHFCLNDEASSNMRMRERVTVFAAFIIAAAFPVKYILETYLPGYYDSSKVLFLLFGSQLFYIVIKGIYVNIYKARREQTKYFKDLLTVIVFGFMANYFSYKVYPFKEAFAIATLLSAIFWYVTCQIHFKDAKANEILFFVIQIVSFLLTGFFCRSYIGLIIYILIFLIDTKLTMNTVFVWTIATIQDFLVRFNHRH